MYWQHVASDPRSQVLLWGLIRNEKSRNPSSNKWKEKVLSGWWLFTNPLWKICIFVKMDGFIFPKQIGVKIIQKSLKRATTEEDIFGVGLRQLSLWPPVCSAAVLTLLLKLWSKHRSGRVLAAAKDASSSIICRFISQLFTYIYHKDQLNYKCR